MSEHERRDEPGVAEDQVDAAAEEVAESTTDAEPRAEETAKPQPEAESVPVPTRDKPADDYPSGVEEAAAALAEGVEMPEPRSAGPTKTRNPQTIETGPGDPSGPRPMEETVEEIEEDND
ncbi:MAG TPA: hypothetical protein VFZ12_06030 [Dehalococcoidia bacterium]|nr:hypothetical protein [Dehalococcoidia bacterium]